MSDPAGQGGGAAGSDSGRRDWSGLRLRVISAAVLIPPVLAVFYFGSPYSDLMVLAASGLLAWEWSRLCGRAGGQGAGSSAPFDRWGGLEGGGIAVIVGVVVAVGAGALQLYPLAGWLVAIGALAAALAALRLGPGLPQWHALGVIYVALPCLGFIWLRQDPEIGRVVVFWLLFVVWATDIGAYAFGRAIGGAKLAPRASPKKTWAGLIGGALSAGLVGALLAAWHGGWSPAGIGGLSVLLALVAQTGDVLESAVKRHFGVKDASQLIPGHGGLMDRVDGLLAASLVVAFMTWLRGALA
ncbi:MAG: phosphatidate cytidylyltransferase [Kiloniellales bacterium]